MNRSRIFGLDLVRASAIMLVLFGHSTFLFLPLTHALDAWLVSAYLGVELFFALSGFLIGGILLDEIRHGDFHFATFWKRRWMRTLPNYFLFLALNLILIRIVDGKWPDVWSYLVFLQCFLWPCPPFFPESWSLTLEEVFYLLAPILFFAFRTRINSNTRILTLLLSCLLVMTGLRVIYVLALDPDWDAGVRKIAAIRLDAFIYGIIAMVWYRYVGMSASAARRLSVCGIVGLCLGAAAYWSIDRDHDFFARTFLFSLVLASFSALLPLAAQWRESGLPSIVEDAIRAISRWSYSLYLCQLGVLRILTWVFGWSATTRIGCFLEAVAFAALSILCAAFVYRYFERPIMNLRDRPVTCNATR